MQLVMASSTILLPVQYIISLSIYVWIVCLNVVNISPMNHWQWSLRQWIIVGSFTPELCEKFLLLLPILLVLQLILTSRGAVLCAVALLLASAAKLSFLGLELSRHTPPRYPTWPHLLIQRIYFPKCAAMTTIVEAHLVIDYSMIHNHPYNHIQSHINHIQSHTMLTIAMACSSQ